MPIKQAIWKVLNDKTLTENMIIRGKERLKDFSWEKCARETLGVLEEAGK